MNSENPNNELIHCIYASAGTTEYSENDLIELLKVSRRNNKARNISGMLLYHKMSFFQVLEGEREIVENLYDKIKEDKRHDMVLKLIVEPIENRSFENWTMGHARVRSRDLRKIPGLNDCVIRRGFFGELPEGRARELLRAFKKGKWHQTIE